MIVYSCELLGKGMGAEEKRQMSKIQVLLSKSNTLLEKQTGKQDPARDRVTENRP